MEANMGANTLTFTRLEQLERVAEALRNEERRTFLRTNRSHFAAIDRDAARGRKIDPKPTFAPSFRMLELQGRVVPVRRDGLEQDYFVDDDDSRNVRVTRKVLPAMKLAAQLGYTYPELCKIAKQHGYAVAEPAPDVTPKTVALLRDPETGETREMGVNIRRWERPRLAEDAVERRGTVPTVAKQVQHATEPTVPEARAYNWRTRQPLFY